jgi:copper chaperone CopZ
MKNLLPLLFLLFLLPSCGHNVKEGSQSPKQTVVAPENAITLEFQVEGMSCTDCENTINKSIQSLPGISEVKSSFKDSTTLVRFDKTLVKPEDIKAAIELKGYAVKDWKSVE